MQKNPNFLSQLSENEQTPAKIWELLRHNQEFRSVVETLRRLDAQAQNDREMTGTYHGTAWEESCTLITEINDRHPFAGVALQWLVPEPLFYCSVAAWPRGKKWKNKSVVATRNLREGHGTTPNVRHKNWVWTKTDRPSVGGQPMTRGPRVHLTKSRFKALRSKVNPFQEWKNYAWTFTLEHSWQDAPPQFRREMLFIWRRAFDYRSVNPITKDRSDTTMPHETKVVQEWELLQPMTESNLTLDNVRRHLRFGSLVKGYRIFAIPKTILTKATADEMGNWLAAELKKGNEFFGDLLKDKLLNESELFGTTTEWADWHSHQAGQKIGKAKDTHFYRRARYINSLVDLVYPQFEISKLLASPQHRARGKQYVRKN